MGTHVIREHKRTNIFIVDEKLWIWAQYKAKDIGYKSVSEYLFDLIKIDKEKVLLKEKTAT
jgi:hypothetical protein